MAKTKTTQERSNIYVVAAMNVVDIERIEEPNVRHTSDGGSDLAWYHNDVTKIQKAIEETHRIVDFQLMVNVKGRFLSMVRG